MFRTLYSLLSPAGARARLSVLIFHRVAPERDPLFPGEVTREEFSAICSWLKQWCEVLPLGEAARRLRAGRLPARAVSITFDDGYADNHDVALPVLQAHGLTATFFIATGFLDGGRMWNDTLIETVRRAPGPGLATNVTAAAALGELPLATLQERRVSVQRAIDLIKYLEPAARQACVDALAARAGVALPDDLMMSSQQVRNLHAAGMTIGGHTVTHPILARLDAATARREIAEGRSRLNEIVGKPIDLFAYPNGRPGTDYTDEAVRIVRELGFDAAVSTAWGAAKAGADPLQLPRYTPWDRTRVRFGLRMARTLAAA